LSLPEYEYAAKKDGVMRLFQTEQEAYDYADVDSTIAQYTTDDGTNFDFVKVVGVKTSAENIAKILQS
jgi:hypothetical protein